MDYKRTLGILRKSNLKTKRLLAKAEIKKITREELLGLEFKRGEEVIDRVTGQRGKIAAGTTTYLTKVSSS